ncbi:MAG: shikimate kinase [Pyrinomonadaceae bacterium]
MTPTRPIIIAGFMGSGKTIIAESLARKLKCAFVDLDHQITLNIGRSPKEIIENDGEQSFREIETRILEEVLRNGAARVIALGGGAWPVQGNQDLISKYNGITVWLDVPFEVCWERIQTKTGERPLAADRDRAELLYAARHPHYARAELRLKLAANDSVEQIANEIAKIIPGSYE